MSSDMWDCVDLTKAILKSIAVILVGVLPVTIIVFALGNTLFCSYIASETKDDLQPRIQENDKRIDEINNSLELYDMKKDLDNDIHNAKYVLDSVQDKRYKKVYSEYIEELKRQKKKITEKLNKLETVQNDEGK